MDSTAFSLHYRSLARSDSGDLKTPSRFSLKFEETLPGQASTTAGNSMVLCEPPKNQPPQSGVMDSVKGAREYSDMSLTGLGPKRFDFDRLSPTLDAILVEGSKDLPAISPLNPEVAASQLSSPVNQLIHYCLDNKGDHTGVDDSVQPQGTHNSEAADTPNVGSALGRVGKHDTVLDDSLHQIKTPDTSSIKEIQKFVEDASAAVHKDLEFLIANSARTPLVMGNGRQLNASAQSKLGYGVRRVKESNLEDGGQVSNINEEDCEYNQVETRNASIDKRLDGLTRGSRMHQGLIITDSHGIDSFRNLAMLTENEPAVDSKKGEEDFSLISVDSQSGKNSKTGEITDSCLEIDQADSTVENRKDDVVCVTYDKPFSSPVMLNQKLSQHVECQRSCSPELRQLKKQNESINSGLGQDAASNSDTTADGFGLPGFENSGKTSSDCMVSQSASKRKPAESPGKMVLFLSAPSKEATTRSPSVCGPSSELLHSNMQDFSHKDNSDGHCHLDNNFQGEPKVALSPVTKSGFESSSGKKRKGSEILLPGDGDKKEKFGRIIRSPGVHKIGNSDIQLNLEQRRYMRSGEKLGDQTWNDWAGFLKRFFGSTQHLLSQLVDKLNLGSISELEDILVHLQKVKQCEFLCFDIHSQNKIADTQNVSRHKRYVEGRMLMLNILYKKAKLQLMHMKRDRLLKQVQQLNHGLQESQKMELNFKEIFSKSVAVDTQANDIHITTGLLNSEGKCQKVIKMRQELENLTSKAKSLSEFFHSACKIEGTRSFVDTLEFVRDYIQKRTSLKFINQMLKPWNIEDLEHIDGGYKVILNYSGFIMQRFAVNACPHSIITSNDLNDVNIVKTFPNINASSAFEFVLNARTTKKCTDSIGLRQETQITSSLLSNLLEVLEEVQLSCIEIRNLIQAKFFSHSGEQLDLQLVFINFGSGRKVKVTFDLTCIKCGVYPAKVIPSLIHGYGGGGMEHGLPLSLVSELRSAAESVGVGYSRIIRVCKCISQVIQLCT
ncbi:hypothetical protein PIB30_046758 [Stylosanthes scabra]|uniref:Knl1 C-terminal RWD domain-containing protein n=1 Tax=Stylosanthes scabra TaxID=79078 RepID=A0ABU6VGL4_9FABA|nr:hypothetical protein [Stylosanthes scabra]